MNSETYNFYFNKLKDITYAPQDHWDIFNDKYYERISSPDSMDFFRRNGISNMLETGLPSQDRNELINNNRRYGIDYNLHEIEELKSRFGELKIMLGDYLNTIEFNSEVGSPRRFIHRDGEESYMLNFDDLYHVYEAWQLHRFINFLYKDKAVNQILEIGAGYGNLAHKMKSLLKDVKYIIIDLPEVLLIQHYYLSKNNPSYKIVNLLNREELVSTDVNNIDCDILLIPFSLYESLNVKFDVVINSRSFGEMPKDTLTKYIEWIQCNISPSGILYAVNRYVFTKSLDKNKIRAYPFDDFWTPIVSQPQWLQTHLHEFLLQRVKEKPNPPLSFLLESFPISTPPPGPIMEKIQTQPEWMQHQSVN